MIEKGNSVGSELAFPALGRWLPGCTVGSKMKFKLMGLFSAALLALAEGSGAALAGTQSGCGSISNWCPDFTTDLFAKNGGPGEQGLGLTNDPYHDNEIASPDGIYLGLQDLGHATRVQIGSVQLGETWAIWGTNNFAGIGTWTEIASGVGTGAMVNYSSSLLGQFDQLIVADPLLTNQDGGNSNNIVLASITTAPEPGALALFAAGLLGCALFVSRRRYLRQR